MSNNSNTPVTKGVHHVGLTVSNLDVARHFFVDTLRFEQVGEVPDYPAVFLSDGGAMITLWQAENPTTAVSFDRKSVIGLHHLALTVDGDSGLDALYDHLKDLSGVNIEFAPESLGGFTGSCQGPNPYYCPRLIRRSVCRAGTGRIHR